MNRKHTNRLLSVLLILAVVLTMSVPGTLSAFAGEGIDPGAAVVQETQTDTPAEEPQAGADANAQETPADITVQDADPAAEPAWSDKAVKTEEQTVTLGNPYTPAQSVTAKWTGGSDYLFNAIKADGTYEVQEMRCADYLGNEGQVSWFAYTAKEIGDYTVEVWATDAAGNASEKFIATVHVVDPEQYEYTMTLKVAPEADSIKLYQNNGFDENGYDIPGEEIALTREESTDKTNTYTVKLKKGTYSVRGTDAEGRSIGGTAFTVPMEAKTAGSSETLVFLREVNVFCQTKIDDKYCTKDQFLPEIKRGKQQVTMGDAYVDENGMTGYKCLVVAGGNDLTYQARLRPLGSAMTDYVAGGYSPWVTFERATTVNVMTMGLSTAVSTVLNIPNGAEAKMFLQKNYYNDETYEAVSKEQLEDGTWNWTFKLPKGGPFKYRVSKEGKITRAGWMRSDETMKVEFDNLTVNGTKIKTENPQTINATKFDGIFANEASVLLNVNSRNHLVLKEGETFKLRGYRAAWEIVNSEVGNCIIEPDFHIEKLTGDDVIDIQTEPGVTASNNWMNLTATGAGTAIYKVYYDALYAQGSPRSGASNFSGLYGATATGREGLVVVQTDGKANENFKFEVKTSSGEYKEWDGELDTSYTNNLPFRITGDEIESVEIGLWNKMGKKWTWTTLKADKAGEYVIANTVTWGTRILKVTAKDGTTAYQFVRVGYPSNISKGVVNQKAITNVTDPTSKVVYAGDTIRIKLENLKMPVPKMSGVYNPGYMGSCIISFKTPEGKTVSSKGVQYNFTNKAELELTIPAGTKTGKYTLTNGKISVGIMAAPNCIGKHREITDDGLNVMFNAVSNAWWGCSFDDLTINVKERVFDLNFETLPDSTVTLYKADTNAAVTGARTKTAGEKQTVSYSGLKDDYYVYTIQKNGYTQVNGLLDLTARSAARKQTITADQHLLTENPKVWDGKTTAEPERDDDGTYRIRTGAQFAWFAAQTSDIKGKLADDIDLGGFQWTGGSGRTHSLDGAGHTIRNLFMNAKRTGLFVQTDEMMPEISDSAYLSIKDLTIEGLFCCIGLELGGEMAHGGIVESTNRSNFRGSVMNCVNKADSLLINDKTKYCGGIGSYILPDVDEKWGTENVFNGNINEGDLIVRLKDSTAVEPSEEKTSCLIGGVAALVAGEQSSGRNSVNRGRVIVMTEEKPFNTVAQIGGIFGGVFFAQDSYNAGEVVYQGHIPAYVGGIVGNPSGDYSIENCYNAGNIISQGKVPTYVGGINGGIYNKYSYSRGYLKNCYNTGNITGDSGSTGGLIGFYDQHPANPKLGNFDLHMTIGNCYNIGTVTGSGNVGALVGEIGAIKEFKTEGKLYALEDTGSTLLAKAAEGISTEGMEFLTEAALKNAAHALGNAFKEDTANANGGYPVLRTVAETEKYAVDRAKAQAQNELNGYLQKSYSEEDRAKVSEIIAMATADLNEATTEKDVSRILENAKKELDSIAEADHSALDRKKAQAQVELGSYLKKNYSTADTAKVNELVTDALTKINGAATTEEVEKILKDAKAALDQFKTVSSSSGGGGGAGGISSSTYTADQKAAEELNAARLTGQTRLLTYLMNDYSADNRTKVVDIINDTVKKISVAKNAAAVNKLIDEAVVKLDATPTRDNLYRIETSRSAGGKVTKSLSASKGEEVRIKFIPNKGYKVSYIKIDGQILKGSHKNYHFENLRGNHTVYAKFVKKTYKITTSKSGKGIVTKSASVRYQANKTIYFKPAKGYKVSKVLVDGKKIKSTSKYTFRNVRKAHKVKVYFVEK